jgi:hypothetical protein
MWCQRIVDFSGNERARREAKCPDTECTEYSLLEKLSAI